MTNGYGQNDDKLVHLKTLFVFRAQLPDGHELSLTWERINESEEGSKATPNTLASFVQLP